MLFTEGSPEQRGERGDGCKAGARVCVCVRACERVHV